MVRPIALTAPDNSLVYVAAPWVQIVRAVLPNETHDAAKTAIEMSGRRQYVLEEPVVVWMALWPDSDVM